VSLLVPRERILAVEPDEIAKPDLPPIPSFMDSPIIELPEHTGDEFEAMTQKQRERILYEMLRQSLAAQVDFQAKLAGYEVLIRELTKKENVNKLGQEFMGDMLGGFGGGLMKGLF